MNERLAFNGRTRDVNERVRHDQTGRARGPVSPPPPAVATAVRAAAVRPRTDWAWRGAILFTFVTFFRPQDQFRPLQVLHLAELFALVGIGALVLGRLARRQSVTRVTPEILGIFAFSIAMLLSVPTSIWPGGSVHVLTDIVIKLFLIFVLLVNTVDTRDRIDRLTFMLVLLSGYVGVRAVFDTLRGVNTVENGRLAGAIGGIFGNPNDLATNMVVFLPFALLWAVRPVAPWKRAAAIASALLMVATISFTQSRAGTLGLLTMMTVLVVGSIRVKPAIAALTVVGVLAAIPVAPASFWSRLSSIVDADKDPTGSRQQRIDLMKEAWHVYLEHPITGVGVGQFPNYAPDERDRGSRWRVTHNAPLQVATEEGTLGLAAFLYLIWCGIKAPRETRRLLFALRDRAAPGARRRRRLPTTDTDADALLATGTAAGASMAGWFVCAFFASIALNWTLYYLLAIAACTRDVTRDLVRTQAEPAEPALARVS